MCIRDRFITAEEIKRLAKALSQLGVSKIRLTGGEPTIRKDFFEIVNILKENSGIKKTVITICKIENVLFFKSIKLIGI